MATFLSGKLTRNQALVLGALTHAQGPMSAYDILDRLRADGLRSPLQIYRALGPLVERGLIHRLESLSSFVACAHPHDHSDGGSGTIVFAICGTCGQVDEFSDETVAARLTGWARNSGFQLANSTVELRGTCAGCLAA